MDFRRGSQRDEPEMNLVPMIDVLLVIVIFLVVTTTYSRYSELQINLHRRKPTKRRRSPTRSMLRSPPTAVMWSSACLSARPTRPPSASN